MRAAIAMVACAFLVTTAARPAPASDTATKAAPPQTIVSLTFDDGFRSQMDVVPLLEERGMRGTFYVVSGYIGNTPRYMSASDVRRLVKGGHEIGGHTLRHDDLTAMPLSRARSEICEDRKRLEEFGTQVSSFSYPYDAFNERVITLVESCGYSNARLGSGLYNGPNDCDECPKAETWPEPGDRWLIRTNTTVRKGNTAETLKGYVQRAERVGGLVPIVFHHVCDGCEQEAMGLAEIEKFLDWLNTRPPSTRVATLHDAVEGPRPTPPTPPKASNAANDTSQARDNDRVRGVVFSIGGIEIGHAQVLVTGMLVALALIGGYRYRARKEGRIYD